MTNSSSTEWANTTNTPSPVFFPSASPTPKLSSTPSKKPPSPVDWQQDLGDESNKEAAAKHPALYNNAPFTFDGDITRPELNVLLEKLQQSTLSADTMTSSFVEEELLDDVHDDDDQDDLISQQLYNNDHNLDAIELPNNKYIQKQLQQESDSQQLRQWLEQLPEIEHSEQLEEVLKQTSQKVKRASLMNVGKQLVTKMKKAAGNNNSNSNNNKKADTN